MNYAYASTGPQTAGLACECSNKRKPKSQPESGGRHGSDESSNQAVWIYPLRHPGVGENESKPGEKNQVGQTVGCPVMSGQRLHEAVQGSVRILRPGEGGIE